MTILQHYKLKEKTNKQPVQDVHLCIKSKPNIFRFDKNIKIISKY